MFLLRVKWRLFWNVVYMIYVEVVLLREVVENKVRKQFYKQYTLTRAFIGAYVTFFLLNYIVQVTRWHVKSLNIKLGLSQIIKN